jgi:multisubunit Na+/H+ antiporter MnhF subunit
MSDPVFEINALEIVVLLLIGAATLMGLYRLLFGPTNPDRVVSADALSVIATVLICLLAALFDSILYLDVALLYGVLSFVGMIALARAIESGYKGRK